MSIHENDRVHQMFNIVGGKIGGRMLMTLNIEDRFAVMVNGHPIYVHR